MRRRLFTILSALSLLLFVAAGGMWVARPVLARRMQRMSIHYRTETGYPRSYYEVGIHGDGVFARRMWEGQPPVAGPYLPADRHPTPQIAAWEASFGRRRYWRWLGLVWADGPVIGTGAGSQLSMLGMETAMGISYGALALMFAVMPMCRGFVAYRRWRRVRTASRMGLCRACGYDLRASKERCPECGTAMPPNVET